MRYHIGLDSTDSPLGGCTTYTASLLLDELNKKVTDIQFIDYPRLIRLNPNIPIKTRGNAAIAFTVETECNLNELFSYLVPIIEVETSKYLDGPAKSGLIIITDKSKIKFNYLSAIQKVINYDKLNLEYIDFKFPNHSIGHIGALAAIYADLSDDFTYELLTYRQLEMYGRKREMSLQSIIKQSNNFPSTFCSYDKHQNRELIAPSGPDPIYYGIRGEIPSDLLSYSENLVKQEKIASWTIYKTNQATNAHVNHPIADIIPYHCISTPAQIIGDSKEYPGGHVKLYIRIKSKSIDCMVFEPTKQLRDVVRLLIPGDMIYIHGNVREDIHGLHIALEYMTILSTAINHEINPPICECGSRMTKAGKLKGYKCKNCGSRTLKGETIIHSREVFSGQRVYASNSAQRHLTRPVERLHRKNKCSITSRKIYYHEFRQVLSE